jgi:hypothetical protein
MRSIFVVDDDASAEVDSGAVHDRDLPPWSCSARSGVVEQL